MPKSILAKPENRHVLLEIVGNNVNINNKPRISSVKINPVVETNYDFMTTSQERIDLQFEAWPIECVGFDGISRINYASFSHGYIKQGNGVWRPSSSKNHVKLYNQEGRHDHSLEASGLVHDFVVFMGNALANNSRLEFTPVRLLQS